MYLASTLFSAVPDLQFCLLALVGENTAENLGVENFFKPVALIDPTDKVVSGIKIENI